MNSSCDSPERRPVSARSFGARFVDLLDRLEGEDDVGHFGGLAVPDELDLALVVEQEKAVAVGERAVGFEEADDLLLFLLGETGHRLA